MADSSSSKPAPTTTQQSRDHKERTLNGKGSTFHRIGISEQHWLSSLPDSDLPLLDAGACYGVQTMHAMRSGRDVLALDACEQHISILHQRVAEVQGHNVGKLIGTIVAELPASDVVADASVSGILCSEVVHFLKPGDLRPLFTDFFRWLTPGGKLVLTVASWPPRVKGMVERGMRLPAGRTVEDVLNMLKNRSAAELVDAAPGLMLVPEEGPAKALLGDCLYFLSTEELRELGEWAGFIVEEVRYYNAGKFGVPRANLEPETVLLVARKPAEAV